MVAHAREVALAPGVGVVFGSTAEEWHGRLAAPAQRGVIRDSKLVGGPAGSAPERVGGALEGRAEAQEDGAEGEDRRGVRLRLGSRVADLGMQGGRGG